MINSQLPASPLSWLDVRLILLSPEMPRFRRPLLQSSSGTIAEITDYSVC